METTRSIGQWIIVTPAFRLYTGSGDGVTALFIDHSPFKRSGEGQSGKAALQKTHFRHEDHEDDNANYFSQFKVQFLGSLGLSAALSGGTRMPPVRAHSLSDCPFKRFCSAPISL
jgi:hypothetical protein